MFKKEAGITLVALVITIIVLLILAGVAITSLSGDNSIITKARQASDAYQADKANTDNMLNNALQYIDAYTNTNTNNN